MMKNRLYSYHLDDDHSVDQRVHSLHRHRDMSGDDKEEVDI